MALDILTNYVEATVTSGGTTAPAAGNSETWTVTTNENWPVLSASQQIRVMDKADLGATSGYEIMLVTANANGTGVSWTVTRGIEGTTPKPHLAAWTATPAATSGAFDGRYQQIGTGAAANLTINNQTGTTYTVLSSDVGALIVMDNAAANTVTLPTGMTIGDEFRVLQSGAGSTSFVAGAGATVETASSLIARAQWSQIVATVIATNTYVVGGDTQ